jgi:hypothetical protein
LLIRLGVTDAAIIPKGPIRFIVPLEPEKRNVTPLLAIPIELLAMSHETASPAA